MVKKMKIGKKTVSLGMIFLFSSIILSTALTQAKPDRTTIIFEYTWHEIGHAERMWISEEGIWQLRNTPHIGNVSYCEADFYGDLYLLSDLTVFDDILNPTTFNSVGRGIFEFTGYYNGDIAGFEGKMNFVIENFYITAKFVCHGTGAFDGHLLKGTVEHWLGGLCYAEMVIWN